MVILWYGLVPLAGAWIRRYNWYKFRKHFNELRLRPILDYRRYWQQEKNEEGIPVSRTFRFIGGFESVTDGQTLWIRSEDLTVPVNLEKAETYLLPTRKIEGSAELFDSGEESPEKISWERVSALTEGARVFVGGLLAYRNGRWSFASTKETPLIVIFFDGPDEALASMAIKAGRLRSEYWNSITPYALILGALFQIIMATMFLSRPAFRLTVIVSFIALFIPLYPIIPPGLLFAIIYRRIAWRSRILRIYADFARLPLCYLAPLKGKKGPLGKKAPFRENCLLPGGEQYGFLRMNELPAAAREGKIPMLLPEITGTKPGGAWLVFGSLHPGDETPCQSQDPFATFGILPDNAQSLAGKYLAGAYAMEALAWLILLAGIGLNIFFLSMVLVLI